MSAEHDEWIARRSSLVREKIPAPYRALSVERPEITAWCEGVMAGKPDNLLLSGQVGTGKSGNAWACWVRLVEMGWIGSWHGLAESRYFAALLPEGDRSEATKATTVDVLLLDDVGVAPPNDWLRSRLDMLFDDRWLAGLPTIITTNLPPKLLTQHVGERASSRINNHLIAVPFTGKDRRHA